MIDEPEKPKLSVVAQNSQKEIDSQYAREEINWALTALAANIIRVVRGAGKAYELGRQCARVVESYQHFHETAGRWLRPDEIEDMLSLRYREPGGLTERAQEWSGAIQTMVQGSLQVAASQLLQQTTQERAGESEMFRGLEIIERQRDENRRAREASARTGRRRRKTEVDAL